MEQGELKLEVIFLVSKMTSCTPLKLETTIKHVEENDGETKSIADSEPWINHS